MTPASLLGVCATSALQSALLVALVAGMLFFVRRADAAMRHRVWFLTLIAVVAIPAIDLIGRLSATWPAAGPVVHAVRALRAFVVPAYVVTTILALWALASSAFLLRLAWSFVRIERLRRATHAVSPELEASVRVWAARLGIRRPVSVRTSRELTSPIAIGLHTPLVVLPERLLATLTDADIAYIVVHELAHLRRRDDLTNLIAKIARAIFIFNPSLLIIERQMAVEREIACDDWVVSTLGRARHYARCLANVLLLGPSHAAPAASTSLPLFRSSEQSVARIELLLAPPAPARVVWGNAIVVAAVALIVSTLGVAASTPPIISFDLPLKGVKGVVASAHLDALGAQLIGSGSSSDTLAFAPAQPQGDRALQRALSTTIAPQNYTDARRVEFASRATAGVNVPVTEPSVRLDTSSDVALSTAVDTQDARAIAAESDAAASAEVTQNVTPHLTRARASAHFGVGNPIVAQRNPAVAFTYNSFTVAPMAAGAANGPVPANTVSGAAGGGIALGGGGIAAPASGGATQVRNTIPVNRKP